MSLEPILKKLTENAPDGVPMQIAIGAGIQYAGSVRHTEWPGVYEVVTITPHPRTKKPIALPTLFVGDAVIAITKLPPAELESLQPSEASGIVLAGRPH